MNVHSLGVIHCLDHSVPSILSTNVYRVHCTVFFLVQLCGENVITLSITAVCNSGSSRTIVAHSVSKNG